MRSGVWVAVAAALSFAAIHAHKPTLVDLEKVGNRSNDEPMKPVIAKNVEPVHAPITEFPFVVSVQLRLRHFCGGSLFAPRLVLTTAHCCYSAFILNEDYIRPPLLFTVGHLSVLMGTGNREGFTMDVTYERRGVLRAFPHESFNPWGSPDTVDYDIALLLLSHEVPLSDSIKLVSLKRPTDPMPQDKAKCFLVGWGPIKEMSDSGCSEPEGKASPSLLKVEMHYMDACTSGNPQDHLCLSWKSGQSCMGDSGSPVVCDGHQVAIVGKECLAKCPGSFYRMDLQWQVEWLAKVSGRLLDGFDVTRGGVPGTTPGAIALGGIVAAAVAGQLLSL